MSDNVNENREQNTSNKTDKDPKNSATPFAKNQNTLDLGSMMQLASTLLNNDVIMNSVTEQLISKKKPVAATQVPKVSEKSEKAQISTSDERLVNIANDLSELKEEYRSLATLAEKIENLTIELSELTKVLKKTKEQEMDYNAD